jgi:futalosine hydrolase
VSASRLLVVTSVAAERKAVESGLPAGAPVVVVEGGVGVASAAVGTTTALHSGGYAAVLCVGIGGGIGVPTGGLALGTASIAADLGAQTPDGFLSLDDLGFGSSTLDCNPALVTALQEALPQAVRGTILTVATVTGTAARADWLRERHPDAVAEAMEGFGVATAAARAGLPFVELRAVSNAVGPRDRAAWRIPDALAALERASTALASLGV